MQPDVQIQLVPTGDQTAPIFSLPSEVTEIIVVLLAEYPVAIAALAQTCCSYRWLIYDTPDNHLWRSIFLVLNDDPRVSNHLVMHPIPEVDWGKEYRQRVWACNYFRKEQRRIQSAPDDHRPNPECNRNVIQILISIITTAAPHRSSVDSERSSTAGKPKDDPLVPAHYRAPIFAPHQDIGPPTKNLLLYQNALYRGIPINLARVLFREDVDRDLCTSPEAQAFYKFVAYNGFTYQSQPSTHFDAPDPAQPETIIEACSFATGESNTLRKKALLVAKKSVYDMDYPVRHRLFGPFTPIGPNQPPSPNSTQYVPDWTKLAAVRQVAQNALYDEYELDNNIPIAEPAALIGGRWVLQTEEHVTSNSIPRSPSGEASTERDWAGVTGLWRRLVTWYGYGILLELNYNGFDDETILTSPEVRVVVPIRLRIVSYTHDDDSPEAFPTINVEGEMGGEGWRDRDENDVDDDGDQRHVDGSVSMLADGSVRWTMYTYYDGTKEERQWVSEGVQIGGVGSTAGIIGTWTSASPNRAEEPVGSWWQWRVE